MAGKRDQHLTEETAERYSMGGLSAGTTARIEEHLLICERCRQSVAAADAYLAATRRAAAKLQGVKGKPKRKATRRAG
jgi:anti-sigma factor ChrR (cupin superfamily)